MLSNLICLLSKEPDRGDSRTLLPASRVFKVVHGRAPLLLETIRVYQDSCLMCSNRVRNGGTAKFIVVAMYAVEQNVTRVSRSKFK